MLSEGEGRGNNMTGVGRGQRKLGLTDLILRMWLGLTVHECMRGVSINGETLFPFDY